MSLPFTPSPEFSVGMEMEFQLLDERSLDLAEGIVPLLEFYPDQALVKPEFIQNTVEVASQPCANGCALDSHMRPIVRGLLQRAHDLKMRLASTGAHPFSRLLAHVTPMPRYEAMAEHSGLTAKTQITFATHVHIGVADGDEAILLMSELKTLLPLLIALAANSPFYQGHETDYASYRRIILAASRTYGQPPDFSDWSTFSSYFERIQRAGIFESINDIHWDIRPRPHLGTVEVRAMDAQSTVSEASSMACLIRALVRYLRRTRNEVERRPLQSVPWYVHKDNCFLAAKSGVDASLMVNALGHMAPMTEVLQHMFEEIRDDIVAGEEGFVADLQDRLGRDCLGYQIQLRTRAEGASWTEVLLEQCERLEADVSMTDERQPV